VTTCECSGMTAFEYSSESLHWPPPKNVSGLARYWPLLPIIDPANILKQDSTSALPTPLYRSARIGEVIGLRNLWIKDESVHHTKTFKDRDALVTVSRFQELGLHEFVMSSTGNTAAAFAYAVGMAAASLKAHIFLPKGTIIDFPLAREDSTKVSFVDGDYSSAIVEAKEFSKSRGIPLEGGFSNPCRTEAAKTIAYEIAESGVRPDWYVQGVTNGAGAYGFYKGYSELVRFGVVERAPRLLCVQPDGCAPMVSAFRAGREKLAREDVPSESRTFVTTLSCTNPAYSYPYMREAVLDSGGGFEEASDREIANAFILLLKLEGRLVDPAVAVGLAGIVRAFESGTVDRDEVIVLSLSGGIRGDGTTDRKMDLARGERPESS